MNKDDIEIYGHAYFHCFLDYFIKHDWLHKKFKMKYFNPDNSYNMDGKYKPFTDINLSIGQVRYAFAFGHRHGYIKDISNNKRGFDLIRLKADGYVEG